MYSQLFNFVDLIHIHVRVLICFSHDLSHMIRVWFHIHMILIWPHDFYMKGETYVLKLSIYSILFYFDLNIVLRFLKISNLTFTFNPCVWEPDGNEIQKCCKDNQPVLSAIWCEECLHIKRLNIVLLITSTETELELTTFLTIKTFRPNCKFYASKG